MSTISQNNESENLVRSLYHKLASRPLPRGSLISLATGSRSARPGTPDTVLLLYRYRRHDAGVPYPLVHYQFTTRESTR